MTFATLRLSAIALVAAIVALSGPVRAEGNLLSGARLIQTPGNFVADPAQKAAQLMDADPATVARFAVTGTEPVDLLFAVDGGVIAPDRLSLVLPGTSGHVPPARIDILVSTVSSATGFTSLRTEQIDPLKPRQTIGFTAAAANWVLLRLYPAAGSDALALADIHLSGKQGPPQTTYVFGESPADALDIIGAIRALGAQDLSLTAEEEEVFALAARGALDHSAFETVALLASGVTDAALRAAYVAQIELLTEQAKAAVDPDRPVAEQGAALLEWLHDHALQGGYREKQTNLSEVLDTGVFNCVSSAVLYNAVAGRLGLDVRAIEVPDHAFSIVYDGLNHMDVETTTAQGFSPRRDKVAAFEALTGFRYIPQSNKAKRREIDAAGLAALIYYNHGVTHLKEGRYQQALFANFRALSLDAGFASAATNALAALGHWSTELAADRKWEDATQVAAIGVRLAPEDQGLASNQKAIWQRWAFEEADAARPDAALAILRRAAAELGDPSFDEMRSAIFIRPAEALIKEGNWRAALDLTRGKDGMLDPAALADLTDWRRDVFRRWAHSRIDLGEFEEALNLLVEAMQIYPQNEDLHRTTRYLAQEWAQASEFKGGLAALETTLARVPPAVDLNEVIKSFVHRHIRTSSGSSDLPSVSADVEKAAALLGPQEVAALGASVYEAFGHAQIDAGNWEAAAAFYAQGLSRFADHTLLSQNARYVAQQWQAAASAEGGVEALGKVQTRLRALFPSFAVDPGFGENEIIRQVNATLKSGDFDAATATLNSAQLLIRPETYRDLRELIFDRQAQQAMKDHDWPTAAAVYATARRELADAGVFANNVAYIAQEWTRQAGADAGAGGIGAAMEALVTLFPDDPEVAEMGLRTLRRMVSDDVAADRFDAARQTIASARVFLSAQEVAGLTETLYLRMGSKAIDEADWPGALQAYADGLALAPESRDLGRNIPYVLQEWTRQALTEGGADQLIAELARVEGIYPGAKALPDVLENVIGKRAIAMVQGGTPQSALDLLHRMAPALPDRVSGGLFELTYDRWARSLMDQEKWAEAVEVYERGLIDAPGSGLLENNRDYAASKM